MSDTLSQNTGVGWTANALLGGPQHEALYGSRPLYQAAGARRAPAADAPNTPSDVFIATHGDAQHAIGVVCAGVADSFFGDIAAQVLGAALYDWVWQHRANPPVEREVAGWLQSQHAALAERVNSQGLSGLMNRGGPANLLQRRDQVGSQTLAGFYILALDGSLSFYLLGPLRLAVYSTDLTAAPSVYTGNQGAMWSSRNGLNGQPVARTLRPVQGASLNVADLPAEWGSDFKLLYQPGSFNAAAQAAAATTSVGFAAAMIDPRMGPTTASAPPQPFAQGATAAEVLRPRPDLAALGAAPEPIPFRGGGPPTRPVPLDDERDQWSRGLDMEDDRDLGRPPQPDRYDAGLDGLDSLSDIDDLEEASYRPESRGTGVGLNPHAGGTTMTRGGLLANLPIPGGSMGWVVAGVLTLFGIIFLCLAASLLSGALNPGGGTQSRATPTVPANALIFTDTHSYIVGRFRDVWEQDGGLAVFGLPISNTRTLGALQVQDFQRFRFERHSDNKVPYDVLFANLGEVRLRQLGAGPEGPAQRRGEPDCRFFEGVQHNVCGLFLEFWSRHGRDLGPGGNPEAGSLALFGTPITEERVESINGKDLRVQWFQKARFELHTDAPPEFQVQLGLLGAEVAGGAP